MEQILKCGQWKSSHTFVRFYNKDIVGLTHAATQQFAASILVSEVAGGNTLPLTFFPFLHAPLDNGDYSVYICLYICLYG